ISGVVRQTANLDPVMGTILTAAGLHPRPYDIPSIREAAQGYVRRMIDRGVPKQTSLFRRRGLGSFLPELFTTTFDLMHLEALDAPVAVAVAAKQGIRLSPAELMRCRD